MLDPLALVASLLWAAVDPNGARLLAPREIEFPFQDELRLMPGESRAGKLWRSHSLPWDGSEVPLVVFVHGIIFDGQRHHWLTVDPAGPWDARPFMEELVDSGEIAPLVVAVPSQTRDATDPSKLFIGLDFDAFVAAVDEALAPFQRVDRSRIVVFGHSAAACDPENGAFAVLRAKTFTARALFAVDGCMARSGGKLLASTRGALDVFVTYQRTIWPERTFDEFRTSWNEEVRNVWPRGLRVLERHEPLVENAHLALVEITARRWLPSVLPPCDRLGWAKVLGSSWVSPFAAASALF